MLKEETTHTTTVEDELRILIASNSDKISFEKERVGFCENEFAKIQGLDYAIRLLQNSLNVD